MPYKIDKNFSQKKQILIRNCEIYNFKLYLAEDQESARSLDAQKTIELLNMADYYLADLTFERPSCYYELGYLQSKQKNGFLIAKVKTHIHQLLDNEKVRYYKDSREYEALITDIFSQITDNSI